MGPGLYQNHDQVTLGESDLVTHLVCLGSACRPLHIGDTSFCLRQRVTRSCLWQWQRVSSLPNCLGSASNLSYRVQARVYSLGGRPHGTRRGALCRLPHSKRNPRWGFAYGDVVFINATAMGPKDEDCIHKGA